MSSASGGGLHADPKGGWLAGGGFGDERIVIALNSFPCLPGSIRSVLGTPTPALKEARRGALL